MAGAWPLKVATPRHVGLVHTDRFSMQRTQETTRGRRIELILRQVDALPTLPAVATRLMSLTTSDETHVKQVVELVQSDPSLSARVLSMCRKSNLGMRGEVVSIDRAIVMLGFNAIRNAALSVQVIDVFEQMASSPGFDRDLLKFDRVGFWRHSLAVAIAAELIAAEHKDKQLQPDEAFVCGLLHDIGKLALDHVLPKSFARIVELSNINHGNIAEYERRIVGLDHHTVGKRLAEQWGLPHRLQDCIWLHGSAYDTLPRLEHRRMIGLITLADLLVRQHHIGYSGNFLLKYAVEKLAVTIGLDPGKVRGIIDRLYESIEQRSAMMGLDDTPSRELYLSSIKQANQVLGRLNASLERRGRTAARQGQILDAISTFHDGASPGRSVEDIVNDVAASAWQVLGGGFYAILLQQSSAHESDRGWLLCRFGDQARPQHGEVFEPPPHAPDLRRLDPRDPVVMNLASILPWITDYLIDAPDVRQVRLLPLSCGWGTAAVLLHDRTELPPGPQLAALTSTWGAAIASATQHDGARRLGEDLAEANLALAATHDRLLQTESMARVGEMAAGAAHEMNNPLAVISGRSQLLAMNLPHGTKEHKAAQTIADQAHRLSDLITSLKLFAEPPAPQRWQTDAGVLLQDSIDRVAQRIGENGRDCDVHVRVSKDMPPVGLDAEMIGRAVDELLLNAFAADPKSAVSLAARLESAATDSLTQQQRRLVIQVIDDGVGMDEYVLAHAMDPFFSAKSAGRRVGMGLARAQQYAVVHGGGIDLRSAVGRGTTATMNIALECDEARADTAREPTTQRSQRVRERGELRHGRHGGEHGYATGESIVKS
jgi:putative nucleotidyltransferase with HDIG domain